MGLRLVERISRRARAYYDTLRARNIGHQAALLQLGNRLVGILHDEATAWPHQHNAAATWDVCCVVGHWPCRPRTRLNPGKAKQRAVHQLEAMGYAVTLHTADMTGQSQPQE
jgi:hypothetical protein